MPPTAKLPQPLCTHPGVVQVGVRGLVQQLELVRGASEAIVSGAIMLLVLCAAASSPSVDDHAPNLLPSVQQQPGQRSGPSQAPASTQ